MAGSLTGRDVIDETQELGETKELGETQAMNHDSYCDAYIRSILTGYKRFAFVGASPKTSRPSYFAMKYLLGKGYDIVPVNPGHEGKEILGQRVYASLADIPGGVELVDIFRNSEAALDITKEAIEIGARVVWMQLGIRNDEAARLAEAAGLYVVMNRCAKIEYGRLTGEIGWAGVNTRRLTSSRPRLARAGFQNRTLKRDG